MVCHCLRRTELPCHADQHCSLLNYRRPREASSAVSDVRSPFLRREVAAATTPN
jgi:hypothetical protein